MRTNRMQKLKDSFGRNADIVQNNSFNNISPSPSLTCNTVTMLLNTA